MWKCKIVRGRGLAKCPYYYISLRYLVKFSKMVREVGGSGRVKNVQKMWKWFIVDDPFTDKISTVGEISI